MRHSVDKVLITTHLEHMVVTKMYWHAGYSHTIIIILTKKQQNDKLSSVLHKHKQHCQRLAMSRSSHSVAPLHAQILLGFSNKPEALAMIPHATLDKISLIHVTQALTLTLSSPVVPNGYTTKCSKPYWSNPPFLFF